VLVSGLQEAVEQMQQLLLALLPRWALVLELAAD
jgi:hypothetical protein